MVCSSSLLLSSSLSLCILSCAEHAAAFKQGDLADLTEESSSLTSSSEVAAEGSDDAGPGGLGNDPNRLAPVTTLPVTLLSYAPATAEPESESPRRGTPGTSDGKRQNKPLPLPPVGLPSDIREAVTDRATGEQHEFSLGFYGMGELTPLQSELMQKTWVDAANAVAILGPEVRFVILHWFCFCTCVPQSSTELLDYLPLVSFSLYSSFPLHAMCPALLCSARLCSIASSFLVSLSMIGRLTTQAGSV